MEGPGPSHKGLATPRRVYTTPISTAAQQQSSSPPKSGAGLVETLYNHPSVKIVSFTARPQPGPENSGVSSAVTEPGSLSWSSQLERTIAVGPFRIYRAPGSVAFLSCGSALQPILPKSQCWCVDEASSKFVLQIRRPQYWRIEVPVDGGEGARHALLLREVFSKVLQFEKTQCPFSRSFTVDLPEPPQTPVRKRPWTPIGKTFVSLPPTPVSPIYTNPLSRRAVTRDGGARDGKAIQRRHSLAEVALAPRLASNGRIGEPCLRPSEVLREAGELSSHGRGPIEERPLSAVEEVNTTTSLEPTAPDGLESVGASPQPVALASLSLKAESADEQEPQVNISGFSSSARLPDSPPRARSGTPPVVPLPLYQSFPTSSCPTGFTSARDDLQLWTRGPSRRDALGPTAGLGRSRSWTVGRTAAISSHLDEPRPAHALVEDEKCSASSPPIADSAHQAYSSDAQPDQLDPTASSTLTRRPNARHRPTTSSSISPSRRALSPLPSPANLFTPRQPLRSKRSLQLSDTLGLVRRLPMAVVHKTVEILLSPPAHLIVLMLKVAARIAAGEWRGHVFGTGEEGETIPVRWDWSDEDDDGQGELGGWAADEDWPLQHGRQGPARRPSHGSMKMAGSFPESPKDEEFKADFIVGQESPAGSLDDNAPGELCRSGRHVGSDCVDEARGQEVD